MDFAHLHNHSEYSFLDGATKVSAMAERAKELGHKAIALTDHGTMAGAIDFYSACSKVGIKPIIGIEFYTTPMGKSRLERIPYSKGEYANPMERDRNNYHLVALAQNEEGFSNLCKLTSSSFIDGFYIKNRIDFELLKQYSNGLIISSACLAGEVNYFLSIGNYNKAKEIAKNYKEVFGENYYLEIQNGGYNDQMKIVPMIKKIGKELGIKVIATNDAHYTTREESKAQDYVLLIQQGLTVKDDKGLKMGEELYLKTANEMLKMLPGEEEALDNTLEVADKVDLNIELGKVHIPVYDITRDSKYEQYLIETGDLGE